jgi:uncharacterized protein|uniref:YHS domain-containing protein n=1 Tax=Desulfobacca acetoxidans TaxID=60893 RepID=A0A7C5ENE0_9BACT
MIWRLLLGLALGFLAFRIIRKFKEALGGPGSRPQAPRQPQPDELVQDPSCGTFIPRQEALKLTWEGQEYFFCSEGCLKRFRRQGGPPALKD